MWLKMVFVFLFLIAVEAGPVPLPADSEFKDVSKLLIGKAVHFHWLYQRGFWVSVGGEEKEDKYLYLKELPESKIYFYDWSRFKVVDCDNGFVCIKSFYAEDTYLKWARMFMLLSFSGYPSDKGELRWQIECTNEKFEICRLKNALFNFFIYGIYMDEESSFFMSEENPSESALFEIKVPQAHCQMDLVRSITNRSPVKMTEEVSVKVGLSSTQSSSFSLSVGLHAEISGGFGGMEASVGTSIDTAMEKSSESTQATETTKKTTYTIPPNSKIDIKQRVGVYGPFKVKTAITVTICTDPDTGELCAVRDAKKKLKEKKNKKEKKDKEE